MNKSIFIFVFTIVFTSICSCSSHFPDKIEGYVLKHNILNDRGFGELDLREVLGMDYDTMYVFHSLIPLNGVQNIIGIKTYGDAEDPYTALIGSDSEMCIVIFC
jgi:lipoprotein